MIEKKAALAYIFFQSQIIYTNAMATVVPISKDVQETKFLVPTKTNVVKEKSNSNWSEYIRVNIRVLKT